MPSTTFADLGVPADLVAHAPRARSSSTPFPIQAMTVPDGLAGRDLCGRAPTGSGKTIAFGIPLVARVGKARPVGPRGLVLVPTRELAAQVCGELEWLGRAPQARASPRSTAAPASARSSRRCAAASTSSSPCPGRLTDLIERGEVDLDEVEHRRRRRGRPHGRHGLPARGPALLDRTPATRQTLLFSATLDGDVDRLVQRYQRDPSRHAPARGRPARRHPPVLVRGPRRRGST